MIAALLLRMGLGPTLVKILEPVLIILLGMFVVFAIYEGGVHHERTIWKSKIDTYDQQMKQVKTDADAKIKLMEIAQAKIVTDFNTLLAAERAAHVVVQTKIKEVTKYVTAKADSQCVVPAGAVSLFNAPLSPEVPGLPTSEPGDVDAPTGVALSTVISVAASNNDECVARGEVIDKWQKWYAFEAKLWKATKDSMPKEPDLPR
jgi:hypothetical protein